MPAPIVFFDIAGPDSVKLREFYQSVFDWDINTDGTFKPPVISPLEATLRGDPADKVLYIGVDDVTACLEQIEAHGGKIDVPRFEIKGVVVLGLFHDPAGNRMGLVEMEGGQAKVP